MSRLTYSAAARRSTGAIALQRRRLIRGFPHAAATRKMTGIFSAYDLTVPILPLLIHAAAGYIEAARIAPARIRIRRASLFIAPFH